MDADSGHGKIKLREKKLQTVKISGSSTPSSPYYLSRFEKKIIYESVLKMENKPELAL
jgi:hypothetical protein